MKNKWFGKVEVTVGTSVLALALFGAPLMQGVVDVSSAEASVSHQIELLDGSGSSADEDARRRGHGGRFKNRDGGNDDASGFGTSGRRSRWG